ncbi:MAG: amino-acid N-acetyltransferase [Verrucomicrobia bacterium]|nr:amino-acid N-acetyltransferase [Verrucomicrobiota bacterium]MBV9645104.1 amino-acid N-acetyltransferase [Verrucomicrobiota bacterium]
MKLPELRGILHYVTGFRDKIFVIAIDGEILGSDNFANILLDIAVLRSLNIKVALVHGAGLQIEQAAHEQGVRPSNSDGTGRVDETTLQISINVALRLTNQIMEALTQVDLRAAYANCIIAHPFGIVHGVDFLYSGKVERVDVKILELFLKEEIVPVIPPLGFDGEGKTFRVNSDLVALEVAEALHAAKLIYLSASDGLILEGERIGHLVAPELEEVLKKREDSLPKGLLSKLEHAAQACRYGIPRVHLLNGNVNEALLAEIFSNGGVGTMIYSNEYEQVRHLYKKDIREVMSLIQQSVRSEELVRRTRAEILANIDDYWVLEIDRHIVGCVAMYPYPEQEVAELACLYVSRANENQGLGRKLMSFAENLARERGFSKLIALSTQAFVYLQQKGGFVEAGPEILPPARRAKYESSGRNSRILLKNLTPVSVPVAVTALSH